MRYSKLEEIVFAYAEKVKQSAAYSGSWNDGGSSTHLATLASYRNTLIVKLDLRPSEFYKLNDFEVGEPVEFANIIDDYKIQLAKNIKL